MQHSLHTARSKSGGYSIPSDQSYKKYLLNLATWNHSYMTSTLMTIGYWQKKDRVSSSIIDERKILQFTWSVHRPYLRILNP
mmetsp:Transcript_2276/g.4607  ORF Transcript_2276/g.4607 Transcript_2276/m.4607 type:complete len:82 (-) Transcript_2276:479-724(-)